MNILVMKIFLRGLLMMNAGVGGQKNFQFLIWTGDFYG